tara:strand:+ start:16873 stop:17094 length:222 start_codon:yes stop_codon:yes gene_type:complete
MTEQPENGIKLLADAGLMWVDLTCGDDHGGMCNVGLASATTKAAALRRAATRLREMADRCEEISKANTYDTYA